MCESARQAVNEIKDLGKPVKRGFGVVLDEIAKVHKEMDAIKKTQSEMVQRQATQEAQNTEILKLVNNINEKLTTNKIEENAAQMGLLKKAAKSKFGWVVSALFCIGLICIGIAGVYVVEHSGAVAELVSAAK